MPVAPVVQLVTSKPSDVGTDVSLNLGAVTPTGIFPHKKKKMPNKWRTINSLVQKFDFTVDEGKERLNPFRDKN